MERRTYNRSPVRLDAVVHDQMQQAWDFIIDNYGFDGLDLVWQNKTSMPDSIKVNDLLDVKFTIEKNEVIGQQGKNKNYHLKVKVVRVLENALAVTLFNPSLDAIADLSKKQQQEGMHSSPTLINNLDKKSLSVLEAIKQSFMTNLSHMMEIFLPIVHDAMFQQADQSSNNTNQTLYFDAVNTLNESKVSLRDQFLKMVEKHLSSFGGKQQQSNQKSQDLDELELIDQNEFESWLAVNQLIIHVSPNYEQELLEIELRLAKLLEIDVKEIKINPFSPEVIFKGFSEAIHTHFLNNDILLILFHQFEKVVDDQLFDVYKEINQIFIDNNILPLIEKKKYEVVKVPSASGMSSMLQNPPPQQQQSSTDLGQNIRNLYQAHATGAHLTEINTIQNSVNLESAYQTLKELLSFQNGQEFERLSDDVFASEDYRIELNFLINDLTQIQYEQAKEVTKNGIAPFNLESLVKNCIKKDVFSSDIKNEFEYAVDIIKRIFTSIQEDSWLGKPVKKLLSLLQIPLLKVFLLDKNFFESSSNPARILINKLAIVDFDDENNKFYLKAHSFVLFILKNYDRDFQIFPEVQNILTELLEIQSKEYDENVNRVITHWNAQQFVISELASRLAGQSIPLAIADFISYQWLPILVSTYLEYGEDSSQWRQYLQALDMLILTINGGINDELIDTNVILFIIKQGLEENQQYDKEIMDNIESFLLEGESGSIILLDYEHITELLINGYALSDRSAIPGINEGATDTEVLTNKAIARRLKVNDFLFFKQTTKQNHEITRLQFVWGSDSQNVFVFSNRTGHQHAVFNLMEVVSMFDNGQLSQTKDYDLPLLERCLYTTLGDVHDNIAKESAIDELTGLINQREFIRFMNDRLNQRKQTTQIDVRCSLCFINIDHFSLINDTCGYEAGDQYISEIAQKISQNLASDVICARYGSDEFILMLPYYSQADALKVSEAQRKTIAQYHFNWQDKEFTMTASIGLVSIREYHEVGVFIKSVVTAATIAKEMGRNRVHLLEYDALELNYRQELQVWATKVEQMIKNNQLDIRCQRLHPMLDDVAVPHYEMLLLVKDEDGIYMPPAEFIEAAELYNKMTEVDRWVIGYVFDWFSKHPEQLELMGGIAINLSGQSLNDIDFYSFIQGVFEQYPMIPHEKICFEITETMAITNLSHANNIIHSIKEMGCEFSLDDFGTGLSSYAYLKNLPVDYLKIDGVFIRDIANNPADKAMVKSINEIGHFLGMKTVAEYVENDEIVSILKEIGVDYAQGFGVEKPILISEYMQFINSQETQKVHEKLKKLCSNHTATMQ